MAYIKLINKKYKVEIQKKGFPRLCRRFHTLGDARKFARDIESSMEGGTFEDYSGSSGTTLKEILVAFTLKLKKVLHLSIKNKLI